jgi:hypothetical protein
VIFGTGTYNVLHIAVPVGLVATLHVYFSIDGTTITQVPDAVIYNYDNNTFGAIASNTKGSYACVVPPSTAWVGCSAYTSGPTAVTIATSQGLSFAPLSFGTAGGGGGGGGGSVTQGTIPWQSVPYVNGGNTDYGSGTGGTHTQRVILDSASQLASISATLQYNSSNIGPTNPLQIGIFDQGGSGNGVTVTASNALKVDPSAVTQPVSVATPYQVAASVEGGTFYNGTTSVTIHRIGGTVSASGTTSLVNAVSGKSVYVLAFKAMANAAVNVNLQSHTTTTNTTGTDYDAANGGSVMPFCGVGWFATTAGEGLDINLSGAVSVGYTLVYVQY